MSWAITDVQQLLAQTIRGVLDRHGAMAQARRATNEDDRKLPSSWDELVSLCWPGISIDEGFGGQGSKITELALVLYETGRYVLPGPYFPTVWASTVLDLFGDDEQRQTYLPDLATGRLIGAVALHPGSILGGGWADIVLLLEGDDVVILQNETDYEIEVLDSTDRTRPLARARLLGTSRGRLTGAAGSARDLGWILASAEACGVASACLDLSNSYAKERHQFGRAIGSFQAIKHQLANTLVNVELATAASWDASRAASISLVDQVAKEQLRLVSAVAATESLATAVRAARSNIQIHGGIACTWENDAHIYLRRAISLRSVFTSDVNPALEVTRASRDAIHREMRVELPPESETIRTRMADFRERLLALPESEQRAELVRSGYMYPHWPEPWGHNAGPVEQLVIDEVLADVNRVDIGIGAWVTLTIAQHGTPDQLERFITPSLMGELAFCQMFSEPDAGSDAAAIRTRGNRVDGGWLVSGQKAWTSDAHLCNRGLATVRTDPDASKHSGITMMVIDLTSTGVEIRPLRQITGEENFNEVFFDEVFVPDEDVIGGVGAGWKVARATLGNERISIGRIRSSVDPFELVVAKLATSDFDVDLGLLVARTYAQQALQLRLIDRAISGSEAGPEGNITKLLRGEIAQQAADLALQISGVEGVSSGDSSPSFDYLHSMMLTIAGGTGEIVRSQIAERILGLPREPNLN